MCRMPYLEENKRIDFLIENKLMNSTFYEQKKK